MDKVCILGLGYIGLPTAAMFATHGLNVLGVDVNPYVVETLQAGKIHIQEPGLEVLVKQAIENGRLRVSARLDFADAFIIAVPTPFKGEHDGSSMNEKGYKEADMRFVISAAEAVLPFLRTGNLVILESTSPPLTTSGLVRAILERTGLRAGVDFYLAYSPERVLPGQIIRELVENARVIGGFTPKCAKVGRDLYAAFVKGEIVLTNSTTAEMVKLMENTYRDVNIAIANEFSRLAVRFDINIWEAIHVANLHPRVKILNPGPGVGGHCISVDPWFLVEAAPDITPLILNARKVNDSQPNFVVNLIQDAVGDLRGKRIAALGLAYKPDVDDLRESPAVEVCELLGDLGAAVKAFEPNRPTAKFAGFETVETLDAALKDADIVVVIVGHREFSSLDPSYLASLTPSRVVMDCTNSLKSLGWVENGFEVLSLTNRTYASVSV